MESHETLRYTTKEECILVFLATGHTTSLGADIQSAYITWQQLSTSEKLEMDRRMQNSLDLKLRVLYESLVCGFNIWDQTQELSGAPGWLIKENSVAEVIKYMGSDLLKLLSSMELIWKKTINDLNEHFAVKKVESLLKLPTTASGPYGDKEFEQESRISSQERCRSQDEDAWEKSRRESIDMMELKKLCQLMCSDVEEDKGGMIEKLDKNMEETYVSYEQLNDALEDTRRSPSSHSLGEAAQLRDLIEDLQGDSDLERQVSPILSNGEPE